MVNHQDGPSPSSSARQQPQAVSESAALRDEHNRQTVVSFKVTHILIAIFLLWLTVIQILGAVLFAKGFLLTRLVLNNKSECTVLPNGQLAEKSTGCWHPKTFDRAVVLIIDALRYDFTVPSQRSLKEPTQKHYLDNLPVLHDMAVNHPSNAFLLPFIADPPTATLQRLKGLTTGTLPTFIDLGSNFAGTAIEEDNIIAHLRDAGKTIVHLGDDTWHALFPGYFDPNMTRPYDSFNVWDLHTVDNGVIEHLFPLLSQQQPAWDVIIGHFLGVDHAGHRYGPDHPAMAEKLVQMNGVLQKIIQSIDDDTLLIVFGDHGMDSKGDHGGESDDEIEAALWMYSKKPRFGRLDEKNLLPPATAKERPVGQIDFVSTLSLLLGLPIPFNNLGYPIAEAFVGPGKLDWKNLARVSELAQAQIARYQDHYSKSRDSGTHDGMNKSQAELLSQALKARTNRQHKDSYHHLSRWQREAVSMYRKLWANFNLSDMVLGVGVSAGALILLASTSGLSSDDTITSTTKTLRFAALGSFVGCGAGVALAKLSPRTFTLLTGIIFGISAGGVISAALPTFVHHFKTSFTFPSVWGGMAFVFVISQSAGFASNSYTIHEDTILLFFLSSFGLVSLMSSLRQASKVDRILASYHSSAVLSIGLAFRIGLVLVAAFWSIEAAEATGWLGSTFSPSALKTIGVWLARCVFLMAFGVGVGISVAAEPCISVEITEATTHPVPDDSKSAALVPGKPQIRVFGYANTFGSHYFLFLPILILSTIVLLPPMGQYSLALMTWQILCLLEMLDTNGLIISSRYKSSIGPIVLGLLGSFYFFKTGHQATFASIQWNAAFVPLRTIKYPWSPLLIILNTFGPQIICAAAVPLTVLWKRPTSRSATQGLWGDVLNACLKHMLYYAAIQLATTAWAGHLRRHLMLYRVFMPRYLMSTVILIVVDVVLVAVALTGTRLTGLSVGKVFGY
ncbi:hypothetical protein B0A52_03483 [Exophiala mesophila]|uniref:Uncharacterized protein n=1 Tax=Exophiala mesophila TaxID=212818 RepID=A0A438N5T6_EXOME|nr:hypothetical protein B0A52_03483 [Exophiala mesophila]